MSYFKRNIAIIIGIDNYQSGIPTLKTATNDARKIASVLKHQHGYTIWGLADKQATLVGCLSMLEEFLPTRITESDRLIFYFAGHGIALNGDDGPEGFLIPQDARLGDTSTYLPMIRLQKALDRLPCRHFLTILDCCFAGAFRWSSMRKLLVVPDVLHRQHYDRFLESDAWQVITSASHNQTAADSLALADQKERGITSDNHSPFAAALIEALEGAADSSPPARDGNPPGDGVITASELYLYLRDRVEIATEKNGALQTPGLYPLRKHDRGEYIFHSPGKKINLSTAPPLDESQNPYRGLESFDSEHSELFFGRQALTQKLYHFCCQNPLTVVLGASGTGKSSLVKAGLVTYLQQTAKDKDRWQVLPPMRPGDFPFKELNKSLSEHGSSGSSIVGLLDKQRRASLFKKIDRLLTANPEARFLLVIDQTEELITLCRDRQIGNDFLELLADWLKQFPKRLHIVLTLRSDFEPQFRNLALRSYWQSARFIVPAMTREELREAIEKPAAARVMYFEPYSLVERLVDEVAQMPGALPLLSFALSELYLRYLTKFRAGTRDKRAITQEDYQEIGGVTQSLTRRADCEYEALVQQDSAYKETIRYVMLRMIAVGGGELARRRVPLAELKYPAPENMRVKEIIERFSTARLLVQGQNAEWQPYIEPAHDALVRGWQKLLEWKREEEDGLILQRRLTPAAMEWNSLEQEQKHSGLRTKIEPALNWLDASLYFVENIFSITKDGFFRLLRGMSEEKERLVGKPKHYLWNTNPYLNVLKEKLDANDYLFNQIEAEFLQISIRRKRNIRRIVSISVAGGVIIIGIAIISVLTEKQRSEALRSKANAENAKVKAENAKVKAEAKLAKSETSLAKKRLSLSKDRVLLAEKQVRLAQEKESDSEDLRLELETAQAELEAARAELKASQQEYQGAIETQKKVESELEKTLEFNNRILKREGETPIEEEVDTLESESQTEQLETPEEESTTIESDTLEPESQTEQPETPEGESTTIESDPSEEEIQIEQPEVSNDESTTVESEAIDSESQIEQSETSNDENAAGKINDLDSTQDAEDMDTENDIDKDNNSD